MYRFAGMDSEIRQKVLSFLQERGLRRTSQREAIIEAALDTTDHYTAEELLARVKRVEPSVSRATVYRTLPLLVECGVLRELELGLGQMIYDPNYNDHPSHNHLICTDCNRIVEFEDAHLELIENCLTKRLGFSPSTKMVRIEARCDQLKREGSCAHRRNG